MAEYQGEYGHPYPRVDQYGNPVPPVDQYGNPIPREPPASGLGGTLYGAGDDAAGHVAAPVEYGDGMDSGVVTAPGGVTYTGVVAPGETALAYEGMVVGAGVGGAQLQPATEEEHTFGPGAQLQPTKEEEHTTTLGEKLRRSGSSSSSSEDDGQGGRRKKKSIREKIKKKLPGSHKHDEQKAEHVPPATGTHEKKGLMEKIKEKLPGHHHH